MWTIQAEAATKLILWQELLEVIERINDEEFSEEEEQ